MKNKKTFGDEMKSPETIKTITLELKSIRSKQNPVAKSIERALEFAPIVDLLDAGKHEASVIAAAELGVRRHVKEVASNKGKASGKSRKGKAEQWHSSAIQLAKDFKATGTEAHELTSKVARRLNLSDDVVRPVLQREGLVKTKKKTA